MPTQLAGSPIQSTWSTGSTSKNTSGTLAVSAGDLLVVGMVTENASIARSTPTASGATITWTLLDNVGGASASNVGVAMWSGAVTVGGTATITENGGSTNAWGIIVWGFTAASQNGVGQHRGSVVTASGTASLTPLSPWTAHSFVCVVDGDWAASVTSPTLATNLGAASQDVFTNVDGNYTVYNWHHADSGASPGSLAVSKTAPAETWGLCFAEVLDLGGGGGAAVGQAFMPQRMPLGV